MKQFRFHISLYLIIPFIFAGFSIFSALLAYRLTRYGLENKAEPSTWVFWLIICISVLAFAAGFGVVRFILRPVEQFVEKASKLPAFARTPGSKPRKDWSVDKLPVKAGDKVEIKRVQKGGNFKVTSTQYVGG